MSSEAATALREILLAFSRQEASVHAVMRRLIGYNEWLVPSLVMSQHYQQESSENMIMFSTEIRHPRDQLWLFTDIEAGFQAQAQYAYLGPYEHPVSGSMLFSNLNPDWESVVVNIGSPREAGWVIGKDAFPVAQAWTDILAFDETLRQQMGDGQEVPLDSLRHYQQFACLLHADQGNFITLMRHRGLDNGMVIFTAPDCLETGRERLGPEAMKGMRVATLDGAKLVDEVPKLGGMDGGIINPFGPGPTAIVRF